MSRRVRASVLLVAIVLAAYAGLSVRAVRAAAKRAAPATGGAGMANAREAGNEDDQDEVRATPVERYASPVEMLFSRDGARLYVLCQESGEVQVLDALSGRVLKRIAVGRVPRGFVLSPGGDKLYVASSWEDRVAVVDTRRMQVTASWHVGAEPTGIAVDRSGARIFVANRISSDVAVLDAKTGNEQRRLVAGRGASYLTMAADGKRLLVTHVYPNPGAYRSAPESEITVIDPDAARVVERMPLHSIAGVFHAALSTDGRLGVVAHLHPKNLVPLAHVEHGWIFGDTITVFGADLGMGPEGSVEVPLDELDRYFSYPFGVAISPDKRRIYVTNAGSDVVTVVDVSKLLAYIHAHRGGFAQDLGASGHYVTARIAVGANPRGVLLSRDGRRLYVANRLDDTVSVVNTATERVDQTFVLDGPKTISALRKGERIFYSARYSFQGQIGCTNCHIDSTFDGLTWDLEPDGFGIGIVDNRLLEDIRNTAPYKWNGSNPNIETECGVRTEKYFWRSENYNDRQLADLTLYVRSIAARPNRWRLPYGRFTSAQERGRALFVRAVDKFGKPIAEQNRCVYCHSGPMGTNQRSFDVGTGKKTDTSGVFDTPQLTNIALTAPYLHDGSARALEEIWTVYNPADRHGRTNDLTKDELNDLIEYLKTR